MVSAAESGSRVRGTGEGKDADVIARLRRGPEGGLTGVLHPRLPGPSSSKKGRGRFARAGGARVGDERGVGGRSTPEAPKGSSERPHHAHALTWRRVPGSVGLGGTRTPASKNAYEAAAFALVAQAARDRRRSVVLAQAGRGRRASEGASGYWIGGSPRARGSATRNAESGNPTALETSASRVQRRFGLGRGAGRQRVADIGTIVWSAPSVRSAPP